MITNILKWSFIRYNRRCLKKKYFGGKLSLSGLNNPVTIYRDQWQIPHIYAETKEDMFFAQGFVHGLDRMWQMEMNRRTALGKLAESFGELALETDCLTRTLGFNRLAKKDWELLDGSTQQYLDSYSAGVNAFLKKGKLPIEFFLSGIKPDDWQPTDSLVWLRVMGWTLSHGWSGSFTRADIIAKIGEEKAAELGITYPDDHPLELPDGLEFNELTPDELFRAAAGPFLGKDMEGGGRGSNAWAVTGQLTDTKHPILCNDIHLVLSEPSTWYLNHLCSNDGFHVNGASLPGVPAIMVGHNKNIAWGLTLSFIDCEDIFFEEIDKIDPANYLYKDELKKFEVSHEKIKVKGSKSHLERVKTTVHGPVISSVTRHNGQVLSLSSTALQPGKMLSGIVGICLAENWNGFTKAIEFIDAPSLNLIYADASGNIGLQTCGKVPIRKKGGNTVPVPGSTGEYDWKGTIPFEEMPYCFNPKQGYVISTNNKIVADDYPYYLGNSFMNGYRARRIKSFFKQNGLVSAELSAIIQTDQFSLPGRELVQGLIKNFRTAKPKVQKVIDVLLKWDHKLDRESTGGVVYEILIYKLFRNLVEPELGIELTDRLMGKGEHPVLLPVSELLGHSVPSLFNILQNSRSQWLTEEKDVIKLVEKSLIDTCNWLENDLGYDAEDWQWGKLHQITFNHAFSIKARMAEIFNIGPFPIGGDTDTVFQTAFNPSAPFQATCWSPSLRMIIDLGDLKQSKIICPPGQSGVLGSPQYSDQTDKWLNGKLINMLWERKDVEEQAAKTLILNP